MNNNFSSEAYEEMLAGLFVRFPSFQKVGSGAYKPGIDSMEIFDSLAGHPHRKYRIVHVAGTNGKGSVSNMLASSLAACGLKVGLYTSPHIVDFRERIRMVHEEGGTAEVELVPKEYVWGFMNTWRDTFDHLDMSFFEITTSIALSWFASAGADIVVLETGLGGRLDSTNIVSPMLSVITNIGLDHCDMLGYTLPEIAFEKAGIIKPEVPAVVGESHPEINGVFERKVLYTNLSSAKYMGNRNMIMSLLTFADKVEPTLWDRHGEILKRMDLQGAYQRKNLRTVLAALDVLGTIGVIPGQARNHVEARNEIEEAIVHTAARTDFHGRWEKLSDDPYVICDIGHNEHGLKYNFAQLERMKAEGKCSDLIIVYGSVADKDVDAVIHLMPADAVYVFTRAHGKRALAADVIRDKYLAFCKETGRPEGNVHCAGTVVEAMETAYGLAASKERPLIYVGGSTYVVSETVAIR